MPKVILMLLFITNNIALPIAISYTDVAEKNLSHDLILRTGFAINGVHNLVEAKQNWQKDKPSSLRDVILGACSLVTVFTYPPGGKWTGYSPYIMSEKTALALRAVALVSMADAIMFKRFSKSSQNGIVWGLEIGTRGFIFCGIPLQNELKIGWKFIKAFIGN